MSRLPQTKAARVKLRSLDEARQEGPAEDFSALVAEVRDYLLLVAQRELSPALRAKVSPSDVLQETFLQAQRKISSLAGWSEGEILAWLRGVLLNQIQDAERRYLGVQARDVRREVALDEGSASRPPAPLYADIESPSRLAMAAERETTVEELLRRLPPEYEQVLRLRYWEQLTLEQIAVRMNRSADGVQKLWFRAIERVKRELDRDARARS